MLRGSHGNYAPLASTVSQSDDIPLNSVAARTEYSAAVNTNVLPTTSLTDPHIHRSSRTRTSSPLLNSSPLAQNPPNNDSGDGSTQLGFPSRANSQEPFLAGNSHHSPPLDPGDAQRRTLPHLHFNSKAQFRALFWRGLKRFICTLVLVVLFMYTILHFHHKKVMSKKDKYWFNAIITGLSMALGISVADGFKFMAVEIRWWILSRKKRSLSEVDKILRADKLTVLGRLAFTYIKRNLRSCQIFRDLGLITAIIFWGFINLGSQLAIAAVGLTYSVDRNGSYAQTTPGVVLLPNLTQIFPVGTEDAGSIEAQQFTANSFGNMALSYGADLSSNIPPPPTLFWSSKFLFFWDFEQNTWIFVFADSSPSDPGYANFTGGPSAMYTDRKINSTYSCQSFAVIKGGNGTATNLTVQEDSNGDSFNVTLPTVPGIDTTTYFTRPDSNCGVGCSIIEAFEASHTTSWYYQCNITVGTVINGKLPEHKIGSNLRQMASAGIALRGYGPDSQLPGSQQFQVYPSASPYGNPQKGDTDNMGSTIARFAIGVVSIASLYTTRVLHVTGLQPLIGNELQVDYLNFIWMIMGIIVGVQGAAFVLTAFWANRVVVKDESVFTTARLLRPVLENLSDGGTTMSGRGICKMLDPREERRYIYTVPKRGDEPYRVELGNWPRCRSFPEGVYN